MKKTIFVFSSLIISLLILFQLSNYSLLFGSSKLEIIIALIAIVFFITGIVVYKKIVFKKPILKNDIDHQKIKDLGITKREYEVLKEVAKGHSNLEIANKLFVSESTIKTHVSNILLKMDVSRRTQAVQKAKELNIIQI